MCVKTIEERCDLLQKLLTMARIRASAEAIKNFKSFTSYKNLQYVSREVLKAGASLAVGKIYDVIALDRHIGGYFKVKTNE